MQSKIIRFVLGLSPRSHIAASEFRQINWLPVEKRVDQIILSHTHKIVLGNAASYMYKGFTLVNQHHHYQTRRSASNFVINRVNSNGKVSFGHVAKTLWNALSTSLTQIIDSKLFKFKVKEYFLQEIENSENSVFIFINLFIFPGLLAQISLPLGIWYLSFSTLFYFILVYKSLFTLTLYFICDICQFICDISFSPLYLIYT